MTLGEFYDCVDGYNDRLVDIDGLNLYLGNYIAIGVNNPSKYPNKSFLAKETSNSAAMTSDDELDAYIIAMAKKGAK